jgi:hypothetical protein
MESCQSKFVCVSTLLTVVSLISSQCSFSQAVPDTADPVNAAAIKIYTRSLGDQAAIYNGAQYRRYPHVIHNGHPFFLADKLMKGTVNYDDLQYDDVNLLYDEVNDELITTDVQGDNLVQLYKRKVNAFTIGQHSFINVKPSANSPEAGYYRVLYNGRSQILVREKKSIQVKTGRTKEETERSVFASTDYYLRTPKGYQKFNRLSSLLSLMGSHRKAVDDYIRKEKLRTRAEKENTFYRAAAFYDQLTD